MVHALLKLANKKLKNNGFNYSGLDTAPPTGAYTQKMMPESLNNSSLELHGCYDN